MPNETQSLAGLGEIAAKLDGAGIQWALFAGAAASVYGAERAITDVDILVPHGEAQRLLEQAVTYVDADAAAFNRLGTLYTLRNDLERAHWALNESLLRAVEFMLSRGYPARAIGRDEMRDLETGD